jgi:hypothetical protein
MKTRTPILILLILVALTATVVATSPEGEPIIGPPPPPHITLVEIDPETKTFVYDVNANNLQHNISHLTFEICKAAVVEECGKVINGVRVPGECNIGKDPTTGVEWGVKFEDELSVGTITRYYISYAPPVYVSTMNAIIKFGPYTWTDPVLGPCGEPTNVGLSALTATTGIDSWAFLVLWVLITLVGFATVSFLLWCIYHSIKT